jgi:hypothetical protein
MEVVAVLLHFECHAGLSGTSLLVKALDTNQGTQAQQKTGGRRRLGNRKTVYVAIAAAIAIKVAIP